MALISRRWSPDDDRRLIEMTEANRSKAAIGAALRRTSKAVHSRLNILRAKERAAKGLAKENE